MNNDDDTVTIPLRYSIYSTANRSDECVRTPKEVSYARYFYQHAATNPHASNLIHRNSGADARHSFSYVALGYDEPNSNDASRYSPAPLRAERGLPGRLLPPLSRGLAGGDPAPPRLAEPKARHSDDTWTKCVFARVQR